MCRQPLPVTLPESAAALQLIAAGGKSVCHIREGEANAEMGYARQKLFEALDILVGSSDRLRLRLTYAANCLIMLEPSDFPPQCRKRFQDLRALLTQTPLTSKHKFEAHEITPNEAKRAAREILSLYVDVSGGL